MLSRSACCTDLLSKGRLDLLCLLLLVSTQISLPAALATQPERQAAIALASNPLAPNTTVAALAPAPTPPPRRRVHRKVWSEPSPLAHPALLRFPNRQPSPLRRGIPINGGFTTAGSLDQCLFTPMLLVLVFFAVTSGRDVHRITTLMRDAVHTYAGAKDSDGGTPPPSPGSDDVTPKGSSTAEPWHALDLIALTSYRFYTGFLSATWMPYLLAREGEDLWLDNQSLFMGSAKLIYGTTILLNPIFGRVGDRAAILSHAIGRRLFLRVGVSVAAVGIFISIYAARHNMFWVFMFGITVWRLGEALNDVTTEALVPELVPKEQWQKGSAIKSLMFLMGGLFGYILLLCLPDLHYSWLYYAYLVGMFLSVIPPLLLLKKDSSSFVSHRGGVNASFFSNMVDAYLAPARYEGGFPLACLAVFIFSLGTAPIFFLLLIVRDLVGLTDPVQQQMYFSGGSIVFFLSSAIFAVAAGLDSMGNAEATEAEKQDMKTKRSRRLIHSLGLFGLACLLNPIVGYLSTMRMRLFMFYFQAVLFGVAFGSAFTRFQECTWQALPTDANMANAMGFNVMSRLFGVGIGNFLAGIILDYFYMENTQTYNPMGYVVLCWYSAACVFVGTAVAHRALCAVDSPATGGAARSLEGGGGQ